MTARLQILVLVLGFFGFACLETKRDRACPNEAQSLARALAEDELAGCSITTAGYFAPDEHPILYLSAEDYTQGNIGGGLFLEMDQEVDDRGHKVTLRNGSVLSAADGPRLLQVTGTILWENGVPRLRNVRDLTTWPPRPKHASSSTSGSSVPGAL